MARKKKAGPTAAERRAAHLARLARAWYDYYAGKYGLKVGAPRQQESIRKYWKGRSNKEAVLSYKSVRAITKAVLVGRQRSAYMVTEMDAAIKVKCASIRAHGGV